jgi:hypothetical protein
MLFNAKYRLGLLKRYVDSCLNERIIARYATRHGLLAPKYIRRAIWRLMIEVMPREVARFIRVGLES